MSNISLGIYTPEVACKNAAELFQRVRGFGFSEVQFDFLSVMDEEMPLHIPDALALECRAEAEKNGVAMTVVNGTYNMAHPDPAVREDGMNRFDEICRATKLMGGQMVSLNTGTRNPDNMWVPHPDNNTPEAWHDMNVCMERAILAAEKYDVLLGLETEASNTCNAPEKVRRLIRDMQSDRLRVIMDCANLFSAGTAHKSMARDVIQKGFDLLGEYVFVAHGKDILEGDGISFTYTGNGIVDFPFFMEQLEKIGYQGGMIIHGTKHESEIGPSVDFMRRL